MTRFDLIIFDFDGTLVDTKDDIAASVNALRARQNLPPVSTATVVGWVGDGAPVLVARALGVPEKEAGTSERAAEGLTFFREHYPAHMLDRARPYPGVAETLEALSAAGRTLAVVSNKPEAMCVRMLDGLGLARFFTDVLGGDSLPVKKPDPAPVRHVLERHGVEPARAALVGDGAQDMLAGRAAGVTTVAALYGFRSREELLPTRPDHWIGSAPDLLELLDDR
jgi:phosphoglycolate phosphatase